MQITITARGTELTPSMRDYANAKAAKLEEFFNNIQKIEVVLEFHHIGDATKRHVAEMRVWAAGLKFIQAKEAGQDIYAAIDLVENEIKTQISKHKEKVVFKERRKAGKTKHDYSAL